MHYCVVDARWPEYQAPPPSHKEDLILRLDARGRSPHLAMVRLKSGFCWRCLLKQKYFFVVYNHAGKASLGKGFWDPKGELGVTT